jgi:transposase
VTPQSVAKKDLPTIREHLLELVAEGRAAEAVEMVIELLGKLRDRNTELELQVHKLLRHRWGQQSEKIPSAQLDLLLGLLESAGAATPDTPSTTETTTDNAAEEPESALDEKKKARPHGRRPLPESLPREEEIILVPTVARGCPNDETHGERACIGYERSETLEFEPARFYVKVHAREKLACAICEGAVVIAPVGDKVIEKGLPGSGLLADMIVGKYRDHLPLYRQHQRYLRLGVDLPASTLSDWNGEATALLAPVAEAERALVLSSFLLQTDGTPLKVQDREHPANIAHGELWGQLGDGRHCHYYFTPDQKQHWVHEMLWDRVGYVQCDAGGCFDEVFARAGSRALEVGCWMHARRYFVEALDSGDLRAAIPLKQIKALYAVERRATEARAGPDERLAMRHDRSRPAYQELGRWIAEHVAVEPPKQRLGKALGYATRQWVALGRFLDDGRLPLDNGAMERLHRLPAVGRKNYLFAGSRAGGERAAIAYTLIGGCVINDVEPWEYLKDVLEKLSRGWPQARIDELVPANWADARRNTTA